MNKGKMENSIEEKTFVIENSFLVNSMIPLSLPVWAFKEIANFTDEEKDAALMLFATKCYRHTGQKGLRAALNNIKESV